MRKLGVLLVAGIFLMSMAGCSTKKNEDVSSASPSSEEQADEETSTTKKSTSTTESESSADDDVSDSDPSVPELGDLGDCLEVSLSYASLFLGAAFATDDQKAELEDQLEEIRGKVPADVQDDLDTISQGMSDADGIVELGEYLDSDEFKDADANIQQYFDETCGTSSNSDS